MMATQEDNDDVDNGDDGLVVGTSSSLNAHIQQCHQELVAQFTVHNIDDGRACTGEPPVDPSRLIR